MNYVITIGFLLILILLYDCLGTFIGRIFHLEDRFGIRLISGFIFLFFLGFLIGFPSQYFHISWNLYNIIMTSTIVIFIILSVYFCKDILINRYKAFFDNPRANLKKYINQNIFFIILIVLFSILALTNAMPYYCGNYDDTYYIGKVVNLAGSQHLYNENYFNGAVVNSVGLYRLTNTFELTYAYLGTLFHIDLPFFCRCTMALHNYFIAFLAYRLLANRFISDKYAQYALVFFSVLMLSQGYVFESKNLFFHLRMYDGWQLQTAMFYGSSIIRVAGLPIIFLFSEKLLEKFKIRPFLFLAIIYITLASFSTIFLFYAIVISAFLLLTKFIIFTYSRLDSNYSYIVLLALFVILSYFIINSDKILINIGFNSQKTNAQIGQLKAFFDSWTKFDTVIIYAPFVLSGALFVYRKQSQWPIIFICTLSYLLYFTQLCNRLMIVASFDVYFVVMRFITSIELFCIFLIGIIFIDVLSRVKFSSIVIPFISISFCIGSFSYIVVHEKEIASYAYLGSGMIEQGYQLKNLTDNDQAMPEIVVRIGNYFNKKSFGNYRLLSLDSLPISQNFIPSRYWLMASNRIEICDNDNIGKTNHDRLQKFLSGQIGYEEVEQILEQNDIHYILIEQNSIESELEANKYEKVLDFKNTDGAYALYKN
ncbi:hypothetical protein SAMN04487835_10350 [Sharpea azabuensis]|uniref:DUF6077 domain-containing protein n=1 Tax=Sharpea azabuensis TaxID=322505 RepID=UPI0008F25479|nr:DUF6077 domain-containing protein [Sharpea azabuensis]SFD56367.1 hypothetical protein SAMN04487836_10350 [Sharpea azabuensis]SFK56448.1 hypothetical protein SAMN04487835_10350 [Sharpea azabuensis]